MFRTIISIIQDHVFDDTRKELANKEMENARNAIKHLLSMVSKDTSGNCSLCHGYFHHGTLHKHRNDCIMKKYEDMVR